MQPKYQRILLKLSGESLMGDKSFGLDPAMISQYAKEIRTITELGVEVAIVIGGGNIYRGMNEAETGKGAWRLYGYACYCYQWNGAAGRVRKGGGIYKVTKCH